MLGYYEDNFAGGPQRKRLDGVAFGYVHALGEALADGADAVVSLCSCWCWQRSSMASRPWSTKAARIFVHCVQAENRTPTLAAAWLHRHSNLSPDDAIGQAGDALNPPKPFLAAAIHRLGR